MNIAAVQGEQNKENTIPHWRQKQWLEPRLVVVTLLAIVGSWLSEQLGLPDAVTLIFNVTSYIAGGFYGVQAAVGSLLEREIDVDLLMILAAIGAALIGQWHEGAILLFLFSLSNVLQDYAIGRSRKAISSLFKLYPEEAKIKRHDQVVTVQISEIQLGDMVLIEPGERIPVDGIVRNGQSSIDQSPITGESMPVDKSIGDKVFAGTLNKQGILDVEATKAAQETTLARIIKMVEEAQDSKAPTERFLDIFEQRYALFILIAVGLFIVIPPLLGLVDFESNFYRAMVLMTVASPCALVISVPAAFISAIASAARGGILFKGGAYLEAMAGIQAIAFDKTGTLTIGEPRVTDVVTCCELSENELLRVAASVEARSEHPLAKAITHKAQTENLPIRPIEAFEALAGQGIIATLDGQQIRVGSLRSLKEHQPMPSDLSRTADSLEAQGKTVIGLMRDDNWLGVIAMADQLRPEAKAMISRLHEADITTVMLTGDNPRVAQAIADQVGISQVHAALMPEDKAQVLSQLHEDYGAVAMVGDGVNDAPALAAADVGIAMGAAGTDVALETADVVLMGDKIELIDEAISLSKKARRVVWQNIVFSLAVIGVLLLGVFLVNLPLPLGVFGHEGSTVIVVLNGLISLLLLPELKRRKQMQPTT